MREWTFIKSNCPQMLSWRRRIHRRPGFFDGVAGSKTFQVRPLILDEELQLKVFSVGLGGGSDCCTPLRCYHAAREMDAAVAAVLLEPDGFFLYIYISKKWNKERHWRLSLVEKMLSCFTQTEVSINTDKGWYWLPFPCFFSLGSLPDEHVT